MANPTKNNVVLARDNVVLKVTSGDATPVQLTALNPKSYLKNVEPKTVERTGFADQGVYAEVSVGQKISYTFTHDLLISADGTVDPFLERMIALGNTFGSDGYGTFEFTNQDSTVDSFTGSVKWSPANGGESDLYTINFTVTASGAVSST